MKLTESQQEAFEERAAIMEFDGGLDRKTAERMAMASVVNNGKPQDKAAAAIALMREMVR